MGNGIRSSLARCTLSAVLLLIACHAPTAQVQVSLADSTAGIVVVHGLNDPGRLTIRAGDSLPPIVGRYERVDGAVRFTPRFPLEGIPALIVSVDTQRWTLPLAARATVVSSTRIVAIHPASPVLPANQLRWYLEFSAPMREGSALAHVRLRDANGAVVEKAFLQLDEELWDPSRTRLTLMFDMGRVKQGIQSRADLGPVLVPGQSYTLEISREWLDARGAMLVSDTAHRFAVARDRHDPIDPAQWRIGSITDASREPLRIAFGFPLDHALAERLIAVTSADGERVGGVGRLVEDDRALEFTPSAAWGSQPYQVRVHPALEDVAGNRVGHAFDAELAKGQGAGVSHREIVLAVPR